MKVLQRVLVFIALCVYLASGVDYVYAVDLPNLIKEIKAKYARFEQEIQDMTILQTMKITTPGGEMTQEIKLQSKGKKFRMDALMGMPQGQGMPGTVETTTIYDGVDIWMISPFTGKQRISDMEGNQYQTERNWWDFLSENATIVGTEEVSGRECYVIETSTEAPFDKIWLDKNNLTLVKAEIGGMGREMLLVYSDFRKIKGNWEMPYKTEVYSGGELLSTSVTKSIEVNNGLSDDLFNPDKVEVEGLSMEEMMKKMMQGK